jgi:hypothetical protein
MLSATCCWRAWELIDVVAIDWTVDSTAPILSEMPTIALLVGVGGGGPGTTPPAGALPPHPVPHPSGNRYMSAFQTKLALKPNSLRNARCESASQRYKENSQNPELTVLPQMSRMSCGGLRGAIFKKM